mmetsp:Transcript_6414/g.17655  ORF Transcript_6414/g.17655 Transcript_6414/m.17655 type:complete len:211 (+) Transcript_6414:337-969(+)
MMASSASCGPRQRAPGRRFPGTRRAATAAARPARAFGGPPMPWTTGCPCPVGHRCAAPRVAPTATVDGPLPPSAAASGPGRTPPAGCPGRCGQAALWGRAPRVPGRRCPWSGARPPPLWPRHCAGPGGRLARLAPTGSLRSRRAATGRGCPSSSSWAPPATATRGRLLRGPATLSGALPGRRLWRPSVQGLRRLCLTAATGPTSRASPAP